MMTIPADQSLAVWFGQHWSSSSLNRCREPAVAAAPRRVQCDDEYILVVVRAIEVDCSRFDQSESDA